MAGMWREFLADLSLTCPHARTIGWTGTPFRGNGVWLTAGDNPLFSAIAAQVRMSELLDLKFLSPLLPATTVARIDTDDVRTAGGDYVVSELAAVTDREDLIEATCSEIVKLAADRKRWLVFAVTIAHAEHVAEALRARGVAVDMVSSETPAQERAGTIAAFRAGRLQCLVNVAVLTTGFDVPEVDFIALLRATKSPVLYVQIAGRGMRLAPGKTDCLWADFTDTTDRLGPVDAIIGQGPKAKGKPPYKYCDTCGAKNPSGARFCEHCGSAFPEPEEPQRIQHGAQASAAAILSSQAPLIEDFAVDSVRYRIHPKEGSQPTLRVEYLAGMMVAAKEWVCLSHSGYARRKAEAWWAARSKINAIPGSTEVALKWLEYDANILRMPVAVRVAKTGKYPQVIGYEWRKA
jgi:DNA repair protein RadD